MLRIPGEFCTDLCDNHLKMTRRDLLRIGGSSILGMSLGSLFQLKANASETEAKGGPGWGKAKSIIMVYLQGGPSHLDLWDPKPQQDIRLVIVISKCDIVPNGRAISVRETQLP